MNKVFNLLCLYLLFSGIYCQAQNNAQENKEIASFDSIFTNTPSGIKLPKRYANKKNGYLINYPSNWHIYEYKNAGGIDFFGHFETPPDNDEMSDMGIAIYDRDQSQTFEAFCQRYLTAMNSSKLLTDITVERNLSFTYKDKYKAYSFLFTSKSVGTFDTRLHMFIEKGNKIYHLRGLLSPKYPTESMQLYLEIMTTIQFLE